MRVLENWDVGSLYPNLVRLYGYSSRNQKDKQAYVDLLAMRMKAKHNELSDDFLKPLNLTNGDLKLGLKLPLNAYTGTLRASFNALYDNLQGFSICTTGQLFILQLIHDLQQVPTLEMVSANTDADMYTIEAEYKEALILLKENYQAINLDDIELTKKFIESAQIFEEELIEKLIRNGKDEKVPFDQNAITAAAKLGLDIAQKEAENYLFMYEQTGKILNELENDKLKLEARKKHITDTEVKLSFLETEKEYLVQFLDNERVTAIQGQEEHSKLMKTCSNLLKEDAAQINTLYDLIIKETKKRATNRCYEELYNKAYLEKIQAKEKKFIEKTNGINCANGTLISPNYWRIDSIKAIYDNFDKSVFETYGRKFVAPEDGNQDSDNVEQTQTIEEVVQNVVQNIEAEAAKVEQEETPVVQKAEVQEQVEKTVKAPVDRQAQVQARIQVLAQARKAAQEKAKAKAKAQAQQESKKAVSEEQSSVDKILNAKALPKYKRIQKEIIEDEVDVQETKQAKSKKTSLAEKSMFEIAQESNNDTELDDIEAIIKQAEQSIEEKPQKQKKTSLLKKIVKANKGKLAEE